MILKIEIPEEFIEHFGNDKFNDSLGRICYDIESVFKTGSGVSGRYEWELVEMLADAFAKSKDYDHANERMERRIRRLTWCVESWKLANADLQETNERLRKRIKELEKENKHLDDYIDAYQKSEALDIAKLDKKDERIKELEEEIDAGSTGMRMLEEKCKALETREKEMVEILNSRLAEIRTQEGRIAELEAEVIGYKASLERANFKMCEKDARIKELEECCKWCNGNALPPPPTTEKK